MTLGIIGGTGLYRLGGMDLEPDTVETRWGPASVRGGSHRGHDIVFLARHGERHGVPPHAINHRANLAALKRLGVERVVATSAVGTLNAAIPPGSLALLTDFIDQTSGRAQTFYEEQVVHLDFTEPYCPGLRASLAAAAEREGIALLPRATYLCTNGPRFETPAEIRAYAKWGADVVGMTNVPEVVLAREAEMCYAAVCIATNSAAGLAGQPLTHTEVEVMMADRTADLARLLDAWIAEPGAGGCGCAGALDEYRARGLHLPRVG